MANTDIKVLSNLDLLKNEVSNASRIKGNSSSISFDEDSLSLKTTTTTTNSYVNIGDDSIEQSSKSINLSATDDSSVKMTSNSIDIKSSTITMSHPKLESSIQFTWNSINNTLTIGKKSSN